MKEKMSAARGGNIQLAQRLHKRLTSWGKMRLVIGNELARLEPGGHYFAVNTAFSFESLIWINKREEYFLNFLRRTLSWRSVGKVAYSVSSMTDSISAISRHRRR